MSIQFHATPLEIFEFVAEMGRRYDLALIAMDFPPVRYRRVAVEDLLGAVDEESIHRLILKTKHEPKGELDEKSENDSVVLDLSRPKDLTLRQSLISVRGTGQGIPELWKKVSQQLRKVTKSGVTAVNHETGATAHFKAFRYTDGARALAQTGTVMLPFAGGSELKLKE